MAQAVNRRGIDHETNQPDQPKHSELHEQPDARLRGVDPKWSRQPSRQSKQECGHGHRLPAAPVFSNQWQRALAIKPALADIPPKRLHAAPVSLSPLSTMRGSLR